MSWSGTVTCSHCYKTGHNKRSCPTLSEQIKGRYHGNVRAAATERSKGNENDAKWYEQRAEEYRQQYIKRTKIDLVTGEKVTNKAAKAERMKKVTCGYCGDRGHTRRTCPVVKRDKQVFIEESRRARAAAFEAAANLGIGVGSMFPIRTNGWGPNPEYGTFTRPRYIKSVDWDACDNRRPNLYVYHIDARKLGLSQQAQDTARDTIDNLKEAFGEARQHALAEQQRPPMVSLIPTLDPPKGWMEPTEQSMKANLKREFPTTGNEYDKARNWQYRYPEGSTVEVIKALGLQEHYENLS